MLYGFHEIMRMIEFEIYDTIRDRINNAQVKKLKFYALNSSPNFYVVQYRHEAQISSTIDDLFRKMLDDLGQYAVVTSKRTYPSFMLSRLFSRKKRPFNKDEIEMLETKIQMEEFIFEINQTQSIK